MLNRALWATYFLLGSTLFDNEYVVVAWVSIGVADFALLLSDLLREIE